MSAKQYKILIMGASYGSLLATKILFGGHHVTMVCLPAEAELFNAEGACIRLPVKGRSGLVEIDTRKLPGALKAGGPADFNPSDFDLVALAMQEPQYRSPGVRDLCVALGADADDLVPFEKYANAAQGLERPSSAARALFAGAPNIERVDRLVQGIARQKGLNNPVIDATVELVDARLELNRKKV